MKSFEKLVGKLKIVPVGALFSVCMWPQSSEANFLDMIFRNRCSHII